MLLQKYALILGIALGLTFTACGRQKVQKANGETALTMAQYEALTAQLNAEQVAKNEAEKAEAASPDDNAFALGAALYQNHDFVGAAREFERASTSANAAADGKIWYMLGSCYERLGDIERAQAAFKKSYDIMVAQGFIADVDTLR